MRRHLLKRELEKSPQHRDKRRIKMEMSLYTCGNNVYWQEVCFTNVRFLSYLSHFLESQISREVKFLGRSYSPGSWIHLSWEVIFSGKSHLSGSQLFWEVTFLRESRYQGSHLPQEGHISWVIRVPEKLMLTMLTSESICWREKRRQLSSYKPVSYAAGKKGIIIWAP